MRRPVRFQGDGREREYSDKAALSFVGVEDMTRQEDRDSTDINRLMSRWGVQLPPLNPTGGEFDFTVELQDMMNSALELREGYAALPKNLRERYPTPEILIDAIQRGQLIIDAQQQVQQSAAEQLAQVELEYRKRQQEELDIITKADEIRARTGRPPTPKPTNA